MRKKGRAPVKRKDRKWAGTRKLLEEPGRYLAYMREVEESGDPKALASLLQVNPIANDIDKLEPTQLDEMADAFFAAVRKIGISGVPELVRLMREDPELSQPAIQNSWLSVAEQIALANPDEEKLMELVPEITRLIVSPEVQMPTDHDFATIVFGSGKADDVHGDPSLDLLKEMVAELRIPGVDGARYAVLALTSIIKSLPHATRESLAALPALFENIQTRIPSLERECGEAIRLLTGAFPVVSDEEPEC